MTDPKEADAREVVRKAEAARRAMSLLANAASLHAMSLASVRDALLAISKDHDPTKDMIIELVNVYGVANKKMKIAGLLIEDWAEELLRG